MRWIAVVLIVMFMAGAASAADSGSIPASQQPVVKQTRASTTDIELEAARYPLFENLKPQAGTDPMCLHNKEGSVFYALQKKAITTKSPSTGKAVEVNTSLLGRQPTDLKMTIAAKDGWEGYRKTAKILVTWTIRVEGTCPAWGIGHVICEPWLGELTFVCPKGDVKTFLNAKYTKADGRVFNGVIGQPVSMEIPAGKTGPILQLDPTLTGTYLITADDFPDKQIPADLELQILWENDTSMRIKSPAGMRNMIVNIIPYSKQSK